MDTSVIYLAAFILTALGWLSREIYRWRQAKRLAMEDASDTLRKQITLLQEMLDETADTGHKAELRLKLDEVNTALFGLHSERVRRTLKSAGLPPEEALRAHGLSQLQPEQVKQLKGEIAELKRLPDSDSIRDLLALGNAYYYAEQYEDARDTFDRILNLKPDDPLAFYNRGTTFAKLEKYDQALDDYNLALELKPDFPEALNNRGYILDELEKYDQALADYNRALELKPDYPEALNNRGTTFAKLKKYDLALDDYNLALELKPDYPDALFNRGYILDELERYDQALDDYNLALKLKPDYPKALINRAITFAKLEKYDQALADYNQALELKPDDPDALYNLSCLCSLQGKTDEALLYLEKAINLDNKNREIAKTDKDFDNIRNDPGFKILIA